MTMKELLRLTSADELVQRIKISVSTKVATTRNYNSVFNWVMGRKPVCRGESEFMRHREDFIALGDEQEGGWFDAIVEDALGCLPRTLAQVHYSSSFHYGKIDVFGRILTQKTGSIHSS